MAEQAKETVSTSLKDKLKVVHGLMLLFSLLSGQIDFSTIESVPISKVFLIVYIGIILLLSYIEDHRHNEKTGHYPQGIDIVDQLIRYARRICNASGVDLEEVIEGSKKQPMRYENG